MHELAFLLNGLALTLNPAPRIDGEEVAVPVEAFCALVGAEVKDLDGQLAVCRGELCIPLNETELDRFNGALYVSLADLAQPLGLTWRLEEQTVQVVQTGAEPFGLGIGSPPPAFALPDLDGSQLIGPQSFTGKKAIFYMWASW